MEGWGEQQEVITSYLLHTTLTPRKEAMPWLLWFVIFKVVKHSYSWNSRDLTDSCLFCTANVCILRSFYQLLHWNTFCRFSLNASPQLHVSPAQHRTLKGSSFLKLWVEGLCFCFLTRLLLKQFWCVSSGLLNECCLETLYNSLTLETTGSRSWKTAKCVLTLHHWTRAWGGILFEIEFLRY